MLRESGRWDKLKRIFVNRQHLEPLVPQFSKALKTLPEILKVRSTHIINIRNNPAWTVHSFLELYFYSHCYSTTNESC